MELRSLVQVPLAGGPRGWRLPDHQLGLHPTGISRKKAPHSRAWMWGACVFLGARGVLPLKSPVEGSLPRGTRSQD